MEIRSREPSGADPLTGLRNRACLDYLEEAYASRENSWSLIILDVDHFKLINDIYGHLAGDDVLRRAALQIRSNLKGTDIPVRFGGDEFILVLPDTPGEGAVSLAERLMETVGRREAPGGIQVSLSMGISQSRESDSSITDLIARADKALYRAKENGRGRFHFFRDDFQKENSLELSFSHMVGRRPELGKLRQLLDEAVADTARLALITGEEGVGKSRLVQELMNYCRFMSVGVARSSASELVRHQPYDLVVQPLHQLLGQMDGPGMAEIRSRVEPVHPATLELFPGLGAAVLDDTVYFREERLRFRIFQDVAALYAAAAAIRPVVLVVDNLQWVSEQDLDMYSYVARNTSGSRILHLCMLRRNDDEPMVFRKMLSVRSSVPLLHLELGSLTPQECRNLILFALKDPNVPERLQELLIRQSGGNPLFLRELMLSLEGCGAVSVSPSGERIYKVPERMDIPDSMGQIIVSKLTRLDEPVRSMLRIASLSPDYLTFGLLETVTGTDAPELALQLDTSVKLGLLAETVEPDGEVGYGFPNGAVRDFLHRELSESLRQTFHQRIGSYLERLASEGREELMSAVAYHFCRSRNASSAAEFALKAARKAMSMGANRDAVAWYGEYLDRAGRLPRDRKTLFRAHLNLGLLLVVTADAGRAENHLEKAMELAEGPEEESAVEFALGRNCHQRSRFPEAMAHFQRTVELCGLGDSFSQETVSTSIEARLAISFIHRHRGEYEEAFRILDQVLDLLQGLGERAREDLWAHYYTRRADVLSECGRGEQAVELYNRALGLCREMGDLPGEALVLNNMHGGYSSTGDYEQAVEVLEKVVDMTRRLDDRLGLAIAFYNIAEHHLQLNSLTAARSYFGRYIELSMEIGNELGMGFGHFGLGTLNLLEGNHPEAETCFTRAVEVFDRLQCAEPLAGCRLRLAALLARTGRLSEAGEIMEALEAGRHPPSTESEILFTRGLILLENPSSGADRLLEAAGLVSRSLEMLTDVQATPEAALRYTALAEALQRAGKTDEALEALRAGSDRITRELAQVRSVRARNSIMGRREIAGFRDMLEKAVIPFPAEMAVSPKAPAAE
jgi:diguanylate cyclase (GGDEF)-like protein